MEHVTTNVLARLRRRELEPDELLAVMQHLESCDDCARRGRDFASNDLAALQRELTPAHEPRRFGRWIAVAAAALLVLIATLWLTRDDASEPRVPPIVATAPAPTTMTTSTTTAIATTTTTTTTTAAAYADPEWERLVADVRRSGKLPFPADLDELRGEQEILRGESDPSQRIRPAGVVIDEVRPTFRWPAHEAKRYVVFIFDGEREIARSGELAAPRWTVSRDLPRGRTLTWQVEVSGGERIETIPRPPAPPARFRIVGDADRAALERARVAHPDDHLLHAVLYARAGMRDEALSTMRRANGRAR